MALDRQRILQELGSVMNQLKSADCGCMGKLFGDAGQSTFSPSPLPTSGGCRWNCCHGHGWKSNESVGKPYQADAPNMINPCMGRCNPPKLYADTFNYLTENLVQPTVKEVYNDLKSLSPDNCIVNNPMVNPMSSPSPSLAAQNNMNEMSYMNNIKAGSTFSNNINGQPAIAGSMPINEANTNEMSQARGMGPQIMNMFESDMTKHNKTNPNVYQNDHLTRPMLVDAQMPQGQIGVTPISAPMTTNEDKYSANGQGYVTSPNVNQGIVQSNMQRAGYAQNTENNNPAALAAGHHSHGITKFNEMFPGVMNNVGGNLDFDPMAIAIQMNPANQKQTAINSMNKMMQNNNLNQVFDQSANPVLLAGTQHNRNQNDISFNKVQQSIPLQLGRNETIQPKVIPCNEMTYQNSVNVGRNRNEKVFDQQVLAGASLRTPVHNQLTNQPHQNTASAMATSMPSSAYEANLGQQALNPELLNTQRMIREQIIPADTTRYVAPSHPKYLEYNTLGQPVEKFSAEMYRTVEQSLPQTLSPQPPSNPRTNPAKYSKVKSTVSKTSLMGHKIGRTPSQLQHIYNQYKGSQSYTQQNISAAGVDTISHSEGKLNASEINKPHRQIPVEKIGGDTLADTQIRDVRTVKNEQVMGQTGDVPTEMKPISNSEPEEMAPVKRNTRNGLQDMVYTSYPSSAWSFHGVRPSPCRPGRNRYNR